MIDSEDVPALENALHGRFASRQMNRVNPRREFFRVHLDEIEAAVRELCGEDAEFVRTAVAEEFRESESMRRKEEAAHQQTREALTNVQVAQAKARLTQLQANWRAEPV